MRPLLGLFVILIGCVSVAERLPSIQEQRAVSQKEVEHLRSCLELYQIEVQLFKQWVLLPNGPSRNRDRLAQALLLASQTEKECQQTKKNKGDANVDKPNTD